MRLSPQQIDTIQRNTQAIVGSQAQVWLFGSRLDDTRRGGDVDLLLECSPTPSRLVMAQLKARLEDELQLPVDVLTPPQNPTPTPAFVLLARSQAQRIC